MADLEIHEQNLQPHIPEVEKKASRKGKKHAKDDKQWDETVIAFAKYLGVLHCRVQFGNKKLH